MSEPRWLVRGDLDGFFGLALDNLVQLLLIEQFCLNPYILGFPPELVHGQILPGAAVSLLIGNLYYAWQAKKLAQQTGRTDICALPYGINTPALIAYVFLVMVPAKGAAIKAGITDPKEIAKFAWHAGLVGCFGSGLIELFGAFVAEKIRKATPRAALLSTLAGIALGFISLSFLFRTFAHPQAGFATLAVVLLIYFGNVKFKGGLPGGLIAVALGTAIAWFTQPELGLNKPTTGLSLHLPIPVIGDLIAALSGPYAITYMSVILPMGIFNVIGSLQNIESAEAAGDSFPTRPSLMVNGLGTVAAAVFGSCFPTTIYIGHPGWKALGARAGYSILNGVFATLICCSGALLWIAYAIPVDAGMAIVLWIGIVITAQSFQATPKTHAPAVVIGLLVGVGAWGVLMLKSALAVQTTPGEIFKPEAIKALTQRDIWIEGGFAMEQGFIFTAMILSAMTVEIIEKKFRRACVWVLIAAGLCLTGLIHTYQYVPMDTGLIELKPAWPWFWGYLIMALILFVAPWVTEDGTAHE